MTTGEKLLELETRKRIYTLIKNRPGIYLRELERETNFTIGQLTYHLPILVGANLIKEETTGRFKRFYPLGLNAYERKILPLLRRPNLRKIIILVLENKIITNKELSEKMSLSAATISWYIQILKDANLIRNEITEDGVFYLLMDEDEIIKVLITYKESFLDKMVDRFIEAWKG